MSNPYKDLPEEAFWATAVAQRSMFDISGLWRPKIKITPQKQIVTFGSCFAQHFSRQLVKKGYTWLNCEEAPHGLSKEKAKAYNYEVFSARTGNIYTASLLLQWLRWAQDPKLVPDEIWEKGGRFYDPFRPAIEPDGFQSAEEVRNSRLLCLEAFLRTVTDSDIFVFTLGLTESWWNSEKNYEYPLCPGTAAGVFDPKRHEFLNQRAAFVKEKLEACVRLMREINPKLNFLLTVSPVPLTATKSGGHVLVATSESKSTLRSVAGEVAADYNFIDYFPSFEIINSAPFRGVFFEPNMRSVNPVGVDHVMRQFFTALGGEAKPVEVEKPKPKATPAVEKAEDDVVCEEALLASMQRTKP